MSTVFVSTLARALQFYVFTILLHKNCAFLQLFSSLSSLLLRFLFRSDPFFQKERAKTLLGKESS